MKIGYVVNPEAGKKIAEHWIATIKSVADRRSCPYEILVTQGPMDGSDKGRKAAESGCGIVVAVGGDGTVSEVVNGIRGSGASLGVLPVGSGNDFARTLGIPMNLDAALEVIYSGRSLPIDLGVVNGRYFINVASVGFDAEVVMQANTIKKSFPGPAAYVMGVLKALAGYHTFSLDMMVEEGIVRKQAVLIAVANGIYYGGGMKIAPQARINDGLLDVCLVKEMPRNKIVRLFPLLYTGRHLARPEVEYFKAKRVSVACNNGYINSDGEIVGMCPANFCVEPEALKAIVP